MNHKKERIRTIQLDMMVNTLRRRKKEKENRPSLDTLQKTSFQIYVESGAMDSLGTQR